MSRIESVGWGFGKCNMGCKDCYHGSGQHSPEHALDVLKDVAHKVCPRINSLNYGTGEFLYNPCAVALAKYIKENFPQINQAVTSNGFTLTHMKPILIKHLFSDVDVSIDFANPEKQNDFRQHPLAWDWPIESLEICRDIGMETTIVTCITSLITDRDIMELLELAKKYNVSWRCSWFRNTGRGKEYLKLSAERFWQIINLLSRETVFEGSADPLLTSILGMPNAGGLYGCVCGTKSCRIQTDLTVTPCVFLKGRSWSGGSLITDDLDKIYASDNFQKVRDRVPHNESCQNCEFVMKCKGGCTARAYLHASPFQQTTEARLNEPDDYCPIAAHVPENLWRGIEVETTSTEKVHSGYLCTLIVKPK